MTLLRTLVKMNWRQSTYPDALRLAREAKVKAFGLFHHNQNRSDAQEDAIVQECRFINKDREIDMDCFALTQTAELRVQAASDFLLTIDYRKGLSLPFSFLYVVRYDVVNARDAAEADGDGLIGRSGCPWAREPNDETVWDADELVQLGFANR